MSSSLPFPERMNPRAAIAVVIKGAGAHFTTLPNGRSSVIDELLSVLVLAAQEVDEKKPDLHVVGAKVQLSKLGFPGHVLPLSHTDKLGLYLLWLWRTQLNQKESSEDAIRQQWLDHAQGLGDLQPAMRALQQTISQANAEPRTLARAMWRRLETLWERVLSLRAEYAGACATLEEELEPLLPRGLALAPHQLEMVRRVRAEGFRFIITDDMGLGKTIEALGALLLLGKDAFPLVIAAPSSVTYNWQKEIEKWMAKLHPSVHQLKPHTCGKNNDKPCAVCRVFSDKIPAELDAGENIVLIGSWQQMITHHRNLMLLKPKAVVGDESHYISNHKSQRAQCFLRVRAAAKCVLELTGTLEPNGRHREAYCQIKAVAPNAFAHLKRKSQGEEGAVPRGDWKAYAWRYCGPITQHFGKTTRTSFDGRSNDVEFGWVLSRYTLRRTKPEVFGSDGLPPKTRYKIDIPISDRDRLWIAREKDAVRAKLHSKATELEQRLQGEGLPQAIIDKRVKRTLSSLAMMELTAMRMLIGHLKIPWTLRRLKELLSAGHHVVVFCDFNEVADAVLERASKAFGAEAVLRGRGSMSSSARGRLVEQAQSDKKVRVIVLTRAFREGITLTRFSRTIQVQRWWVPGEEAQMEDRTHRIGQENPVAIDYPTILGSCDDAMAKVAVWKETGQQQSQGAAELRAYNWITAPDVANAA